MDDKKPLVQSVTVWGAIASGLAALASPQVLALLPAKWSNIGVIVGAVVSAIGMRRALPASS